MRSFAQLGLEPRLLDGIQSLGFSDPTPIQQKAIPVLLGDPRDFVGLAQTGTGKTAAFGLPALQLIDPVSDHTQVLILAPTRELCMQITRDMKDFAKGLGAINIVAVYGGAGISDQINKIRKGAQIIVATPGRLIDLIERKVVKLDMVDILVLDEADEMLNMGFQDEINTILKRTPPERLTWLFSATMPDEVRNISKKYMTDPYEMVIGKKNAPAHNIEHIYHVVHAKDRYLALKRIADFNPDIYGIVFCRTRAETQEVAEMLIRDGYNADSLHGDLSQQQRDKVMTRFRQRSLNLLVATDVAARGIDVKNVSHVINYELPDDVEVYTHRTGRTGRAGSSGIAVSIIHLKESGKIRQLEKALGQKFRHDQVPGGFSICERQLFSLIKRVHDVDVNESAIAFYMPRIYEELEDLTREDVIKKFASVEFNRFLDYYMNAPDINADISKVSGGNTKMRQKGFVKLFINLGKADGMDAGRLLRYICDVSRIKGASIGRISLKQVYSFVDVDKKVAGRVTASFHKKKFKGRPVRIDVSDEGKGGRKESRKPQNSGQKKRRSSGGRGRRK